MKTFKTKSDAQFTIDRVNKSPANIVTYSIEDAFAPTGFVIRVDRNGAFWFYI